MAYSVALSRISIFFFCFICYPQEKDGKPLFLNKMHEANHKNAHHKDNHKSKKVFVKHVKKEHMKNKNKLQVDVEAAPTSAVVPVVAAAERRRSSVGTAPASSAPAAAARRSSISLTPPGERRRSSLAVNGQTAAAAELSKLGRGQEASMSEGEKARPPRPRRRSAASVTCLKQRTASKVPVGADRHLLSSTENSKCVVCMATLLKGTLCLMSHRRRADSRAPDTTTFEDTWTAHICSRLKCMKHWSAR